MTIINLFFSETIRTLELMAEENNAVLWIATPDYKKQLYVTRNYEDFWNRKSTEIYKDLRVWQKYLINEHQSKVYNQLKKRQEIVQSPNATVYCIEKPDQSLQWFLDRNCVIYEKNQALVTAGVAFPLAEAQLKGIKYLECIDKIDSIILKFYHLLTKDQPNIAASDSPLFPFFNMLSKREKEVLKYILYGLSAEQIANKLSISRRTVEAHTDAIKIKLNCENKSEIILKAIENNWIHVKLPDNLKDYT